jgi:hypothetical protein
MPGKLKKLAMPKREEIDMAELDMEEMPTEGEMPESDMGEGEEMPVEAGPLADVSDEELMAELKKRGLSSKLAEEDAMMGEMEMEDEEEEEYV